jgi:phosphomevalonate kinase
MTVFAPGKAILCGEYAVLHGAPAIAVAVDRGVRATLGRGAAPSPFVAAAIKTTRAWLAAQGRALELDGVTVDSSALYDGDRKLGLGSSAAVTVAVTGSLLDAAGVDLRDRQRVFELADAAHAEAQGTRGSGVDVAVAVWGGALRFRRPSPSGAVAVHPVALPRGVELTFVFVGASASTANLVGSVKQLAESRPERHDAALRPLLLYAQAFADAVQAGDAAKLLVAADAYGEAMAWLGDAAGVEIVTPAHAQLAELARRHRGAAKPSGAGGGDLGVAFTVGDEATRALREALAAVGLPPLALTAPAPGLQLENR